MPGMSDTEEIQIWRILKKGARPGEKINIKEGDDIRLAWRFDDQTVGYRDFQDDVFGRRRTSAPEKMENTTLYMKLPWPRFEPVTSQDGQKTPPPNALMMSSNPADGSQGAQLEKLSTVYAKKVLKEDTQIFAIQDCTFRLDVVGKQGFGDSGDYLLSGVSQSAETFDFGVAAERRKKQLKEEQEAAEELARRMRFNQVLKSNVALGMRLAVSHASQFCRLLRC